MKKDFAIFGNAPSFDKPIHVGKPNIPNKEKFFARMEQIFESAWLTNNGPMVSDFESILSEYLGVKNCITVCNGTTALEIVINALELRGEIVVPSFTFAAIPHAVEWQGIKPVFADIEPESCNIDPQSVRSMITPETTGIIAVNTWGNLCDMNQLEGIADESNLKLIYDSSHAFAESINDVRIGNFGNAEVFSFHATKLLNTFEGGIITTNDDELAEKIRLIINFGFAGKDNVVALGINGKMSEPSAAMGITLFEELDKYINHNKIIHSTYVLGLEKIEGLSIVKNNATESNYQYLPMLIDELVTGITRDEVDQVLQYENILARRYFYPGCHMMEPYKTLYPQVNRDLPVTELITERILCLPAGGAVSEEDVKIICRLIRDIMLNGREISAKLKNDTEKIVV